MSVYRARMDGFVVGVSVAVVCLLAIVVTAGLVSAVRRIQEPVVAFGLGAASLLVAAILIFAWVYTPRAFRVDDGALRIERPAGEVAISLTSIEAVSVLDVFLGLSWKVPPGGNSGLFGIYGTFYRRDLGKYRMYGRAANGTVLLQTTNGKIVVTPENRDALVAELLEEISN